MKKVFALFICLLTLGNSSIFATEQYIEYLSGEQDDGSIYIDSFDEYLNIMGEVDEQKIYKEEYLSAIASAITYYDEYEGEDTVKARVLTVGDTKEEYYSDGYGVNKLLYQPITVQILEGEHKGEKIENVFYILTANYYDNLKIKPIKENQKINIILYEEEGKIYADIATIDAAVNRIGTIIILGLVALMLIFIYLGKKGLKMIPQLLLLADVILLIFVPEIFSGRSILWLTIVTSILYIIVDSALKVGLNSKTVAAIISTVAVTLTTTLGLILFGNIVNFSGITYEMLNMIETFPKGTIDFYMLYVSSFVLMSVILTSDISCKTINLYDNEDENNAKLKIRDYVAEKLPTVLGILFITIIPKYLYLWIVKYTFDELINTEIITTDIVRILFLIISSMITIQVATYTKKLFIEENK